MTTQTQKTEFSVEDFEKIVTALAQGVPLGTIAGVEPEFLEGLYSLAYNFYGNKDYKSALTIFQALCMYKHNDYRFLMGFGACKQALADYEGALNVYGLAMLLSAISNPEPFYHSVFCLLKLGRQDDAIEFLKLIPDVCVQGDDKHATIKDKAQKLLTQLTA